MKKLITICLYAAFIIMFASCSYQNYNPAETQFSTLTGDNYASNTGWNADHYGIIKTRRVPSHVPVQPVTHSIVVTSQ